MNALLEDASMESSVPPLFNTVLPEQVDALDQKQSGRCWLFAGLNLLRHRIIQHAEGHGSSGKKARRMEASTGIGPGFKLSAAYLAFYDHLEKCYALMETFDRYGYAIDDLTFDYLRGVYMSDGNTWSAFVALVEKYGVVPDTAFPDSKQAANTDAMNHVMRLRMDVALLAIDRARRRSDGGRAEIRAIKEEAMRDFYRIVSGSMGIPPAAFEWEGRETTPLDWYRSNVRPLVRLDEYVVLIHDPRHPRGRWVGIDQLCTVWGYQQPCNTYLNVDMDVMESAIIRSLRDHRTPVWFSADVSAYATMNRAVLALPDRPAPLEQIFGELIPSKHDMSRTRAFAPNHAMLFTGCQLSRSRSSTAAERFQVENSWGTAGLGKGFLAMSRPWFEQFIGCVAVPRSLLPASLRKPQPPILLPPTDIYGTFAARVKK